MARSLAACALPALVICASWLRLEEPPRLGGALVVVALALAPMLVPAGWGRAAAAAVSCTGVAWMTFDAQPWELLPFRDERVLGPVADAAGRGIADFYEVLLPLEPERNPEMHSLVLVAIFGFTLATALLVAARRPVGAAAVTVVGIGWPATLVSAQAVPVGALALAVALSIPLILRIRSAPALLVGAATGAVVVIGSSWVTSATAIARESALDWEAWDLGGPAREARAVRFAWDSNYDGISFPTEKTVVLTVEGPDEPNYWRVSTLDLFADDHWFENLRWVGQLEGDTRQLPPGRLTPARALLPQNWLEQRVRVEALVDDHLAAAGTPMALDARRLGTVYQLSGGVLRALNSAGEGKSYRVWSYVPDPAPAALAAAPVRQSDADAVARFLEIDGRRLPAFGTPDRDRVVQAMFADSSFAPFARQRPLYAATRRVAGDARTPYAAVLALESWFRQRGGFTYDESPPRVGGSPLVEFVTHTKAGYCQHFAGAMASMLRILGIPARVAVGFTSGERKDGKWIVTDHDAHAWVEVWFEGQGWIPFDPTPGRGTFAGDYSYASDSRAAVAALRRGELRGSRGVDGRTLPEKPERLTEMDIAEDHAPSLLVVALLLALAWALVVGLGKAGLRRARYLSRDPRRVATASRRELEGFLRDQGVVIPPGSTLWALQHAAYEDLGIDGRAFAAAAARARFGPPADAARGASVAKRELRELLKRARRELSPWARARGFVSLRSVRGRVSA